MDGMSVPKSSTQLEPDSMYEAIKFQEVTLQDEMHSLKARIEADNHRLSLVEGMMQSCRAALQMLEEMLPNKQARAEPDSPSPMPVGRRF